MNSLERVKATLRYEKTDRIPVIPEVAGVTAGFKGKSIRDYVTSGEILAECQLAFQEFYQYDAVFAFADLCVEAEAIGSKAIFPEDNYPYLKQPAIQSIEDLDKLSIPDPDKSGRMPELIKAVKIMKQRCHNRIPVVAHALGPLTIASRIMDIEKMLYMIVDEPEHFKRLLSYTLEVAIIFIKQLLEAGTDCIIMFNPSASPAVLPPKIFREFELPNLKKIFNFIKEQNPETITWYSVAGATQNIIKDLEHIGLDIMTVDYLVPLKVAFDLSSTLCFNGNIKSLSFVNEGPEEIYALSTELLQTSLERGRFILGSGCEVPPGADVDNIKALVTASCSISKDFKVYGRSEKGKHCVSFFPSQKKVHIKEGADLIEAAACADILIPNLCHKSGACGSCLVKIEKGSSKEYSKSEKIYLTTEQKENNYRLACQVMVSSDMEIYIPPESRIKNEYSIYCKDIFHKHFDDKAKKYTLNPSIMAVRVPLEKRVKDTQTDLEIIQNAIGKEIEVYPGELRRIPEMLRGGKELFCILDSRKKRVLDLRHLSDIYGLAIDIGTSTIAIYLHNLETGEFISSGSILNPQFYFGNDILTRAQRYLSGEDDRTRIQSSLIDGLNTLILKVTGDKGINHKHIYKVVIVGNSVMHHMFLNLELKNLVRSPFTPVLCIPYVYSNKDRSERHKLTINENGQILCPPLLNGFVGSDLTVGILTSELCKSEKPILYVDLGTNGEIALGNREKILITSVAAGSAFERLCSATGKIVDSGMVYWVEIDEDFNVHYKTFEGGKPSGLCGSAVVDTIASFLQLGIIDSRGHFVKNFHCNSLRDGGYVLIPRQDTAFFRPLVITAKDIEEVQKAKGGISAGITVLMREYGITPDELDKIILTGAFGMNINVDNAIRMGLIPEVPVDKVEYLSNAAGVGAGLCLLFKEAAKEIEEIIGKIEHINVANDNKFNDIFIDSMFFKTYL